MGCHGTITTTLWFGGERKKKKDHLRSWIRRLLEEEGAQIDEQQAQGSKEGDLSFQISYIEFLSFLKVRFHVPHSRMVQGAAESLSE
jgi:hypothetical protein